MTDRTTMRAWLDTLDSAELEEILEHSPLALHGAPLRDLDELAMRLQHPSMMSQAVLSAPPPHRCCSWWRPRARSAKAPP